MKDRVCTVATLNILLERVLCVNNVAQFARWFDERMRARYPGRAWNTNGTNKWRKNIQGTAAMTEEWLEYLNELFPDKRYYDTRDGSNRWWETEVFDSDDEAACESQSARDLFYEGPDRLWKAIWQPCNHADELWAIYTTGDTRWGVGNYAAALYDLEMKLYCNFDANRQISYEDLGRAIVLYRIQYGVELYFMDSYPLEWGIRAYLCVKIAMAASCLDSLGVTSDIANYFARLEVDRLQECTQYVYALNKNWQGRGISDPPCIYEYAYNPFLSLCDEGQHTMLIQRYGVLGSLTGRSF